MDHSIRAKTAEEIERDRYGSIEQCPTCEGGREVVDLTYGRERRIACQTCGGSGLIDAGVWPYEAPAP